ncbi:MAG: helix-turn-helix domain-containing protein [Acetatifactor sp.]|nr:helix-turn-helix domain-containing protein [Acetatifactor sp.]
MNNNLIGEQIAKFRKAAGLTQEDLGKAVGVSTQAVSRWECGGAPDVSLLPVIADKLGVTIDTLFGREKGIPQNIADQMCRYIASLPTGKRLDTLCRMLYRCIQFMMPVELMHSPVGYSEQCIVRTDEDCSLLRSGAMLEEGMIFGIGSEEFSFMSLFPEPEAGWAAYLLANDDYRRLFAALARPNALELLELLYSEKEHYIVPEAAAARLKIPTSEAEEIFVQLHETHLLHRLELELASGMIYTYMVNENYGYVPFLLIARCLIESNGCYYLHWIDRKKPLLRKPNDKK